jgi:hypothetical protein
MVAAPTCLPSAISTSSRYQLIATATYLAKPRFEDSAGSWQFAVGSGRKTQMERAGDRGRRAESGLWHSVVCVPQPRIYSAEEVAAMVAEDEEGFRKFKAGA